MPLGDRIRGRRRRDRRLVRDGDSYTVDEEREGLIELEEVPERDDPPPEGLRGEHWGWTKGGDLPPDWNDYRNAPGYQSRDDPGPYDGSWEPPEGRS